MYQHILIPTDGSELAHRGVAHGLLLAKAVGAKVTALTVESYNRDDVSELHVKEAEEHAASILDRVGDEAKVAGVSCQTMHVVQLDPYWAIMTVAKEKGCDLIVMASHGRSGIAAAILGSVTAKVLTHTDIPVLVCH